jgi:hypothetical protein
MKDPIDAPDEGGFSRAIRPDKTGNCAFIDLKSQIP